MSGTLDSFLARRVRVGQELLQDGADQACLAGLVALPRIVGLDFLAGLSGLIDEFGSYDKLQLQGLMAIPPFFENAEDARPYFRKLRGFAQRFGLRELSMGMSHDFEMAIEEGATMVRIGSALFGGRGM